MTNVAPTHTNFSQWVGLIDDAAQSGILSINIKDMQGTEDGTVNESFKVGNGTNLISSAGSKVNGVGFTNGYVNAYGLLIASNNFVSPTNSATDTYVLTASGTSGATKWAAAGGSVAAGSDGSDYCSMGGAASWLNMTNSYRYYNELDTAASTTMGINYGSTLGGGASSGASSFAHPGVFGVYLRATNTGAYGWIASGSGAAEKSIYLQSEASGQFDFLCYAVWVYAGAATNRPLYFVGLLDNCNVTTYPTDGLFFQLDPATTNAWEAVCAINGSYVTNRYTSPYTSSTWAWLQVKWTSNTNAIFSYNGMPWYTNTTAAELPVAQAMTCGGKMTSASDANGSVTSLHILNFDAIGMYITYPGKRY